MSDIQSTETLEPGVQRRVAFLLRWYPKVWRERYGEEFEETLRNSFADGKSGMRMTLDVMKNGLGARLSCAGLIGDLAPPARRQRASLATILGCIAVFWAGASLLAHYVADWRTFPYVGALQRTAPAFERRYRQYAARYYRIQHLPRSARPAALAKLQALETRDYRLYYPREHDASGASVWFDRIAHVTINASLVALGIILLIALLESLHLLGTKGRRSQLIVPLAVFGGAVACFIVREVALHTLPTFQTVGPDWWARTQFFLEGHFNLWRGAIVPVSNMLMCALLVIGSALLMRRAEFSEPVLRIERRLASLAAASLVIGMMALIAWAAFLDQLAPGFLTWQHEGPFSETLLPLFIGVVCLMGIALWAATMSARRWAGAERETRA